MNPKTKISIVDGASGQLVARADLDPGRLPDVNARLRIDGRAWLVVDVSAGEDATVLVVRELTDLTLDAIRYGTPTLCGDLPPLVRPSAEAREAVHLDLSEDAWRQVELVAHSQRPAVEAALGAIRQVRTHARVPGGYKRCHVRRELPLPIAPWTLPLRLVREAFPSSTAYAGLRYPGTAALAGGGFGIRTRSGLELYGLAGEGGVTALGVHGWGDHARNADVEALAALAQEHQLDLLDWVRVRRLPPSQFAAYFAARAGAAPE